MMSTGDEQRSSHSTYEWIARIVEDPAVQRLRAEKSAGLEREWYVQEGEVQFVEPSQPDDILTMLASRAPSHMVLRALTRRIEESIALGNPRTLIWVRVDEVWTPLAGDVPSELRSCIAQAFSALPRQGDDPIVVPLPGQHHSAAARVCVIVPIPTEEPQAALSLVYWEAPRRNLDMALTRTWVNLVALALGQASIETPTGNRVPPAYGRRLLDRIRRLLSAPQPLRQGPAPVAKRNPLALHSARFDADRGRQAVVREHSVPMLSRPNWPETREHVPG